MLRKVNNFAVMEELENNVIPNMDNHNINEVAKYALTLKFFIDMGDIKKLGTYVGMTVGATVFLACTSAVPVAAGATLTIASIAKFVKELRESYVYKKTFVDLLDELKAVHNPTPEDLSNVLKEISAEDLVSFLELKGFICNNKEE